MRRLEELKLQIERNSSSKRDRIMLETGGNTKKSQRARRLMRSYWRVPEEVSETERLSGREGHHNSLVWERRGLVRETVEERSVRL